MHELLFNVKLISNILYEESSFCCLLCINNDEKERKRVEMTHKPSLTAMETDCSFGYEGSIGATVAVVVQLAVKCWILRTVTGLHEVVVYSDSPAA